MILRRDILIESSSGTNCSRSKRNAVRGVLESAVAEAVANHVGMGRFANGQGGCAPKIPAVLVANVNGLRGRVADRIVATTA